MAYTNIPIQILKKGGTLMPEKEVGKVSDFFARPIVAGIQLTATLKVGDKIHIKGHTTDLELMVNSMQINNVNVQEAKSGDAVGIKVTDRVRRGDIVYKVTD
jgi:putative protease